MIDGFLLKKKISYFSSSPQGVHHSFRLDFTMKKEIDFLLYFSALPPFPEALFLDLFTSSLHGGEYLLKIK
jgi:hypothetical protein